MMIESYVDFRRPTLIVSNMPPLKETFLRSRQ
jgi:hypothetical protein